MICGVCSFRNDNISFTMPWRISRTWPIRLFWADTDVFHFSLLISNADTDIFYYSSSVCFVSWGKINTPGAILPSAKHFQTTAKRHYRAFFYSGHINKVNNFTSYNHFMRQNIHSSSALWDQIYTPGAILPPAEHDWLNWSQDKFGQHHCLSWLWHL